MLDTNCYYELVTNVGGDDILVPGSYTVLLGIQEIPQEHLHTFQIFTHASKTTNLWPQQHSSSWSALVSFPNHLENRKGGSGKWAEVEVHTVFAEPEEMKQKRVLR